MGFFQPQNPGIGGIDELTPAEEAFLTSLAGLNYSHGDVLYFDSGTGFLANLGIGSDDDVLTVLGGVPIWSSTGGTDTLNDVSIASINTAQSVYQMATGVDVNFKSNAGDSIFYINEANDRIGFGVSSLTEKLESRSTTDKQLRLSYSSSVRADFYVLSSGILTIEPTAGFVINSNSTTTGGVNFNWNPTLASSGRFSMINAKSTITTDTPDALASFASIEGLGQYNGTGTMNNIYGSYYSSRNVGTGTVNALYGQRINIRNSSTGTVGNIFGISVSAITNNGTITGDVKGISLANQGLSGVTNSYGIYLQNQQNSTNSYAIYTNNGRVRLGGSLELQIVSKSANYTLNGDDYTVDCTANTFTITLPTASGITGRIYNIHNSGTGVITVNANGSETIEGDLTQTLSQWENLQVQSNGTNWIVL